MVRPAHNSREAKRRKAQKRLGELDYIPMVAKMLSEVLILLAENKKGEKSFILEAFSEIANQKPTWEVIKDGGSRFYR